MNPIAIITAVVVAILTVAIFGLAWLAYRSCVRAYGMEVSQGMHDDAIGRKCRSRGKGRIPVLIGSWATLLALSSLFVTGVVYRARGENLPFDNRVALVIRSGSMSDFCNDAIAEQYGHDRSLQFGIGDICAFDLVPPDGELHVGEVYGYRRKGVVVTHRLASVSEGLYRFRGDNNLSFDGPVSRDMVVYHYTGHKVPAIGTFVLYAQSYFGLWSLACMVGITVSSEVVHRQVERMERRRNESLPGPRKVRVRFRRRDGTEAIIYERGEGTDDEGR